jgi:hypothetical protein
MEYRIFWVNKNLPRIRGPVWDVNRKLAEDKLANINKTKAKKASKKGGE